MKQVITVKEARKLLGKAYQDVEDKEIQKIIDDLDFMSSLVISHIRKELVPGYTVGTSNNNEQGE